MISEWKAKIAFTISEVIEFYFLIHSLPTELTELGQGAKCDWTVIRSGGK